MPNLSRRKTNNQRAHSALRPAAPGPLGVEQSSSGFLDSS